MTASRSPVASHASSRRSHQPVLHEQRDELRHEQRVALGSRRDPLLHRRLDRSPEERLHEAARVVVVQRQQLDRSRALGVAPGRAGIGDDRSRGDEQQQRCLLGRRCEHLVEEVEEGRLGVMGVLDDDDERPAHGEGLEVPAGAPEHLLEGKRPGSEAHDRRHPFDGLIGRGGSGDRLRQLLACALGRVVVDDAGRAPRDLDERPEGDAVAIRQAATVQHGRRCGNVVLEDVDEVLLADAGLAGDHEQAAPALADDGRQAVVEQLQLRLSPDHREVGRRARFVAPARGQASQAIRGNRFRLALQGERLDRLGEDMAPDEGIRDLADEHLVDGRGLLEAGGHVDGIPGREPLLRGRVGVRDDLAGVDAGATADADAVLALEVVVQPLERADHAVGRADGAQRVVLAGPREAEDRHDRVPDVLLDPAAVTLDLVGHRREVPFLHLVDGLRIDALAEGRAVLEVGEDDGHDLADLPGRAAGRSRERPGAESCAGALGTASRTPPASPSAAAG